MTEEMRLKEGVMAEEIRVVEHYSASILNKVGEGAPVIYRPAKNGCWYCPTLTNLYFKPRVVGCFG